MNRFGLETENSGKVRVTLNMCMQDAVSRKFNRKKLDMNKSAMLIETKKQVMHYKLKIKEELEARNRKNIEDKRTMRRTRNAEDKERRNRHFRGHSADGYISDDFDNDSLDGGYDRDRDEYFGNDRNHNYNDPYYDQNHYENNFD